MHPDSFTTLAWGTFSIRRTQIGSFPRLVSNGVINAASAPLLRSYLATLLETRPARLLVDLNEVTFIDSTGLDVLVETRQRLVDQEGTLVLLCSEPVILRILEDHGLRQHFYVYRSAADLVDSTDDILRTDMDWSDG